MKDNLSLSLDDNWNSNPIFDVGEKEIRFIYRFPSPNQGMWDNRDVVRFDLTQKPIHISEVFRGFTDNKMLGQTGMIYPGI